MIRISNTLSVCPCGHYLSSQRTSCARCRGFTDAEFTEARKSFELLSLGTRVAVKYGGNLYPYEKADIVNGLNPHIIIPEGWFIYYMRFTHQSQELYKIGISQKPWERVGQFAGKMLSCEYLGKYDDAYREEQRLLKLHAAHKKSYMKLRHGGGTEVFTKDVLGKG
jgi:hypothetical protein